MTIVPPARHLLRAKDLIDARYREPLDVPAIARAAHLSPAHFSREFRRAFGETPHQYLLTRRMERAAALLRSTDRTVADICLTVGLQSVGSFTTTFGRTFGLSPTAYRAAHPPAAEQARIPTCVLRAYARPRPAARSPHTAPRGAAGLAGGPSAWRPPTQAGPGATPAARRRPRPRSTSTTPRRARPSG
jgi:AraC-like DNA-binding protein